MCVFGDLLVSIVGSYAKQKRSNQREAVPGDKFRFFVPRLFKRVISIFAALGALDYVAYVDVVGVEIHQIMAVGAVDYCHHLLFYLESRLSSIDNCRHEVDPIKGLTSFFIPWKNGVHIVIFWKSSLAYQG